MDLDEITIEDYTVKGPISQKLYDTALQKHRDPFAENDSNKREIVPIQIFKSYLTEKIQMNLQDNPETQLSVEQSQIADIVFAFDNKQMLKLLTKRYKCLLNANFKEAEKIETQLTQIKNEKFD